MTPRFALVGAAGFVAPRHLAAIQHVGGKLVAALDPHDAVGVLDRFDKTTEFFTDEYRFERWLEKQRLDGNNIDWLVVCSPNYMHDRHIRMGLWSGARVLCEKPLVVNPENLDRIAELEREFADRYDERRVFTVLQLRHAPMMKELKSRFEAAAPNFVKLSYRTPRGPWYHRSWKGDPTKSGGLVMNIGVHMFDLMIWLFGAHQSTNLRSGGDATHLVGSSWFTNGTTATTVDWALSLEETPSGKAERWMELDTGERIEFAGFENLHNMVYEETLAGRGNGIDDARPALELVAKIRG